MNFNLLILPNFRMGGNVQALAGPPGGKSANYRGTVRGRKIYHIYMYIVKLFSNSLFYF